MKSSMILSLLLLTSTVAGASAQGTPEQRAACTSDVWRLCSSEIPNISGIVSCLKKEKPNLSPGCRVVMNSAAATEAKVTTRSITDQTPSISSQTPWCHVNAESASDDPWRKWCGDKAW